MHDIIEGTIIHATLRPEDLLSAFSSELERIAPGQHDALIEEARSHIDNPGETAFEIIDELADHIDTIASTKGFYFGAHPGDGSDFGYWTPEEDA